MKANTTCFTFLFCPLHLDLTELGKILNFVKLLILSKEGRLEMWVRSDIHINWCECHKELSELNKLWQNETCVQLFLFCKAMYFLLSVVCFVTRRAVLQSLSPAAGWVRVTTHKNISTPLCPLKTESIALYSCFALFCRAEQPDVVWVGTKINITATCLPSSCLIRQHCQLVNVEVELLQCAGGLTGC